MLPQQVMEEPPKSLCIPIQLQCTVNVLEQAATPSDFSGLRHVKLELNVASTTCI